MNIDMYTYWWNALALIIAITLYIFVGQSLHEFGHFAAGRRINPDNPASIILYLPMFKKRKLIFTNTTLYLLPFRNKREHKAAIVCFADNFQGYSLKEIKKIASAGYRNNMCLIILILVSLLLFKCYCATGFFVLFICLCALKIKSLASKVDFNDFAIKKNPKKFLEYMSKLKPGDERTTFWCLKEFEEI